MSGPGFETAVVNLPLEYETADFHSSSVIKKMIHGCLFSDIGGVKYEYALANYCYAFFVKHKLEASTGKSWYDFFFDDVNGLGGSGVGGTGSIDTLLSDETESSLAALVVYALIHDANVKSEPSVFSSAHGYFSSPRSSKTRVFPGDLYRSLIYESSMRFQEQDNPFKLFCEFVGNVLDDTVARTERMTGGDGQFFYETSNGSKVTRAGGLDARAFVFMCFKLFKKVFATDSSTGGSPSAPEPILLANAAPSYYPPLPAIQAIGHGSPSAVVVESPEYRLRFFIPSSLNARKIDASAACHATPPTGGSGFTAFSDARNSVDHQLRFFGEGLGHLGTIRRSVQNARVKAGIVTVGAGSEDIIKEFLPSETESEVGKVLFSRFGTGHLSVIAKNFEHSMSFIGKGGGSAPTQVALLPYRQKVSPPPSNLIGGRYQTMMRFLANSQNMTFSEDNIFDPSNAKIACLGIPAGGIESLHAQSMQLNNASIEAGTNNISVGDRYSRDNSLLKISITKTDALLPDVEFEDVAFYYDPRLYVAAGGFDDCIEDKLEDDLESIQFKRAVVTDEGSVDIVDVEFSVDTGFSEGAGSISSLEPAVARQLAYVTASSDLFAFYLSLVCGMELEEPAFGIEDGLMDQGIDTNMIWDTQNVDSKTIINTIPSLDISVPFDTAGLDMMIGDPSTFGNYETSPVLDMADIDPADISPANVLTTRQILSSLLFKPHTTRTEILFPRRFEGVVFCYVDPAAFKVSDFGDTGASTAAENALKDQGLAIEHPEGSGDFYIIKSGNNEDASGVIGLNVTADPVLDMVAEDLTTSSSGLEVMLGFSGGGE